MIVRYFCGFFFVTARNKKRKYPGGGGGGERYSLADVSENTMALSYLHVLFVCYEKIYSLLTE